MPTPTAMVSPTTTNTPTATATPITGQLIGSVFDDRNGDGVRDADEVGVAGVRIVITDSLGIVRVVTTDNNGNYDLTGIAVGTATIDVIESSLPAALSLQTLGGATNQVSIQPNRLVTAPLFGFHRPEKLSIEKMVETSAGGSRGMSVKPGDHLTYMLIVHNLSDDIVRNLVVTDQLSIAAVSFVDDGSAVPAPTRHGSNGVLVWHIASLNAGTSYKIQFVVKIREDVGGTTLIRNTAAVSGQTSNAEITSRVSNVVDNPLEPGAVTLQSFTAAPQRNGSIRVRWVTLAEVDTWGFMLYRAEGRRSETDIPSDAIQITPATILAEGRGASGDTYEFVDVNAERNRVYTYWLVESEIYGNDNVYGPSTWQSAAASRVYLPMLQRIRSGN